MVIVPFESFNIITELSEESIKEKIKNHIDYDAKGWVYFGETYNIKPFKGKIHNNGFRLVRIIKYRNSFLPVINGKIIFDRGKNVVKISMRLNFFVGLFWLFWMTGVSLFCLIMIFSYTSEFDLPKLFPFGMLLCGYLLCLIPFNYEANKAREIIEKILAVNLEL